jgi:hypothetical protein
VAFLRTRRYALRRLERVEQRRWASKVGRPAIRSGDISEAEYRLTSQIERKSKSLCVVVINRELLAGE